MPFIRMFLFAPRSAMWDDGSEKERVDMTSPEILKALSQGHERWPGDAVEAASSRRSEVSSLLLEKLAQAVAEIERIEAAGFRKASLNRFLKVPSPLFYGVFLLADWREKAAYRPFARLMRFPWVAHDNLLGEPAIEEPGYRIMASLFDDRTVAADFARQAFGRLSPDEGESLIWAGWEKLISRLALTELAPLVRKAHDADLLVESTYEEFQQDLEYAVAHPDAPCRPGDELAALAGVRELEPWVEL